MLTLCSDLSPADWIVASDLPWQQLVSFGPSGFAAYARLRFLPDPAYAGQSENDVVGGWHTTDQLRTLLEVLAAHTSTPEVCYACVWDGYDAQDNVGALPNDLVDAYDDACPVPLVDERPGAQPGVTASPLPLSTPQVPKVGLPHRAYYLFRGPLFAIGYRDAAGVWPGQPRLDAAEPAFVWPADHAWCVADDVDPHWAGIGASTSAIARLVGDPRLDVVLAEPREEQPCYG